MRRPAGAGPRALAAAVGLLLAGTVHAQDGGRHAAPVLVLPASPRAAALGDAYLGVTGDDAAVFYDASQLATVRGGVGLSVERYLGASILGAFSAAARVGPGTAALGIQSLRADRIEETVGWEPTGRTLGAGDAVVSAAYGAQLGAVRVGVAGKYVRQRVAEASGGAAAADVAVSLPLRGGAVVSLVAQNLGGDLTLVDRSSPLPRRTRLGAAVPVALSPRLRVLGTALVTDVSHEGRRLAGGAEARWTPRADRDARPLAVDLRVGVRERTHGAALSPWTAGAGVTARSLALDYAWQGYDALGATHRLGVRWSR